MTGTEFDAGHGLSPWAAYINREHLARDMYLTTVQRAHREYLTGPWPDREAYKVVELQAWMTYYATGRDAWRTYRAALENPSPPPPPPAPQFHPYQGEGMPDHFDQRQETFLAADPLRRGDQ